MVFNSITDNPNYGDERAFLDASVLGSKQRKDVLQVRDGQTIVLRAFYLNDAASNLNLIATDTRVRLILPTRSGRRVAAKAEISAANAQPRLVSDTATLVSDHPFAISYERGSAAIWTNGLYPGHLPDAVVADGTLIGYKDLDGRIPSDIGHGSGWVTVRAKVHAVVE